MFDLSETSGLPLQLDEKGCLHFGPLLAAVEPAIRCKKDMLDVLYQPEAGSYEDLYYMYRDVARAGDRELMDRFNLRYDVTVLRPGLVGKEYIKTAGHYHPLKPGTDTTYPEVYEVLLGKAHYLLQTEPDEEEGVDAILIEAAAGDKVLIPPGYGHITINPSSTFLVMSNWVAGAFSSVYGPIRELRGGAYFELQGEDGEEEFVVNARYQPTPRLSLRAAEDRPEFGLLRGRPMYMEFLKNPEKFSFLEQPEKFF